MRRMLANEPDVVLHYCSDPLAAIDEANRLAPTVILQDLVMPGVDGLDLLRRFRENASTADTPIVVLSSQDDARAKSQAFASGARDYLVKLPDRIELVARVRYHSHAYTSRRGASRDGLRAPAAAAHAAAAHGALARLLDGGAGALTQAQRALAEDALRATDELWRLIGDATAS